MANNALNTKLAPLMEQLLEEAVKGLLSRLTAKACGCEDCDNRIASAQDFSNVLKLLKDNGFVIDPLKGGDALDEIISRVARTAQYPEIPQRPS
jgi:hypothetical protein